jgi:hypothetical protein
VPSSPARRRDLFELTAGYVLILAVIWTSGTAQRTLYWFAFVFILATSIVRRQRLSEMGLASRGLRASLWIVIAALLLTAGAAVCARRLHTLHPLYGPPPLALHLSGYLLWAFLQQFILQVYVLLRLLRLGVRRDSSIWLATLLFVIAHVPNPVLMGLTLLWGLASCRLFLRYRNLYTLAISHCILGVSVAITVPNDLQHHMRVGLGYFTYHPHPRHDAYRRSTPHTVSTVACVIAEAPIRRSCRHARP